MDEKEEVTEKEERGTDENTNDGNKRETTSLIEQANAAAKRLEEANKKKEELLKQEQEIEARRVLGGVTEGGKIEQKKDETPAEYRARIEREIAEGKYN